MPSARPGPNVINFRKLESARLLVAPYSTVIHQAWSSTSRLAGWLALTCLLLLMLLVLLTTVYAGYLWRTTHSQARS